MVRDSIPATSSLLHRTALRKWREPENSQSYAALTGLSIVSGSKNTFFLFKLKKPQNFFNVVIFLQIIFHKPRRSIKIRSKYLHFQIMNTNKFWITSCPKARAFFESVQLWKTYLGFKQNFGNQTFQAFSTRIKSMNSNLDLKLWPIGANQN